MEYLYGAGLLFAAFLVLAVSARIARRMAAADGEQSFGFAECAALFVTAITAIGLAVMTQKALSEWSLVSTGELIAILGVLIALCAAASRTIARLIPIASMVEERPVGPAAPANDRPGRPGGPRRAARAPMKRAA